LAQPAFSTQRRNGRNHQPEHKQDEAISMPENKTIREVRFSSKDAAFRHWAAAEEKSIVGKIQRFG